MRTKIFSAVFAAVSIAALCVAATKRFGHWDTTAVAVTLNIVTALGVHALARRYYTSTVACQVFDPEKRQGFAFWLFVLLEALVVWAVLCGLGITIAKATATYNALAHGVLNP